MRTAAPLVTAVSVSAIVAVWAGCAGCGGAAPPAPVAPVAGTGPAANAKPPRPGGPLPVFVDVATEAGLTAMNHTGKPAQKDWIVSGMGGGSMVFDYDRDGWMDLVVVDGTMLTEDGVLEYHDDWRTRLYRNLGGMKFEDVTLKAGIDIKAFGFGGATCDYDADGFPDFYVCCWGRNYLMRNRGDGTFEDVTDKAGLAGGEDDMTTACCWGDVNGDGWQDLYVANYSDQRGFIRFCQERGVPGRHTIWRGVKVYAGPMGISGQQDRLYFGSKDGTFRDVTDSHLAPEAPPGQTKKYGFQPVMSDVDNDGDLDIYVPNDTQPNFLWVNDGKGRFGDRAVEAGCASDFDAKDQASMGVDIADVNRDGWLDIVVTHFSHDHTTLYENKTGRARAAGRPPVLLFQDLSNAYNVTRPSFLRLQWGTRLFDYDSDGELDLFIACGHVYGEIDQFETLTGTSYRQQCLLLHNAGGTARKFEDVTDTSGPALQVKRVWRGAAFADFDNDGDQDVFVTALNDRPALFRNDGGNRNAFLVFRLTGKDGMRDPSGARVTIRLADGVPRIEELHHGASFCNDNDPRLFFGLGAETSARKVEIRWPNGDTQTFENVAARKFYAVEQGKDALEEETR